MTRRICGLIAVLLISSSQAYPESPPVKPEKRLNIVFVVGDHEYSSEETMPAIAAELVNRYGFTATVLKAHPDENSETDIPGLQALEKADLAVFFLRWRRLPKEQVEQIGRYLDSGRPVVAFRTTTHAFNYPRGHELEKWNGFAADYLGAPPGWGKGHFHYGHRSSTDVSVNAQAAKHPVLTGVALSFHVTSWLYHVLPNYPPAGAERLLIGKSVNPDRPDAIENPVAWTWKNKAGGRVFMTTLGHPDDFKVEAFQRLMINGVHWAAGKRPPQKWAGPVKIDVKYHGIRTR